MVFPHFLLVGCSRAGFALVICKRFFSHWSASSHLTHSFLWAANSCLLQLQLLTCSFSHMRPLVHTHQEAQKLTFRVFSCGYGSKNLIKKNRPIHLWSSLGFSFWPNVFPSQRSSAEATSLAFTSLGAPVPLGGLWGGHHRFDRSFGALQQICPRSTAQLYNLTDAEKKSADVMLSGWFLWIFKPLALLKGRLGILLFAGFLSQGYGFGFLQ